MSMPYRAPRVLRFEHGETPQAVGPGAYLGHARYIIPPNFTGFSTSFDRNREPVFTSTAHQPGPGHYISKTKESKKAKASASFASKEKRFSSSQTLPPGPKYDIINKNSWIKVVAKPRGPQKAYSLANNKRSKGKGDIAPFEGLGADTEYEGEIVDEVKHTGIGDDTVGPGKYNVTRPSGRGTNFHSSSTKRKVFNEGASIPGPGAYGTRSRSLNMNSASHSKKGSAAFVSSVPMAHEKEVFERDPGPGPGAYDATFASQKNSYENAPFDMKSAVPLKKKVTIGKCTNVSHHRSLHPTSEMVGAV